MTGWPALRAWALACCEGDESQHPMCPHWAQRRRCTHHPGPSPLRHSRQPVPLGVAERLIPGKGRLSIRPLHFNRSGSARVIPLARCWGLFWQNLCARGKTESRRSQTSARNTTGYDSSGRYAFFQSLLRLSANVVLSGRCHRNDRVLHSSEQGRPGSKHERKCGAGLEALGDPGILSAGRDRRRRWARVRRLKPANNALVTQGCFTAGVDASPDRLKGHRSFPVAHGTIFSGIRGRA